MRWFNPILWTSLILVVAFLFPRIAFDEYVRAKDISYHLGAELGTPVNELINLDFIPTDGKSVAPLSDVIWLKIPVPAEIRHWQNLPVLYTGSNEPARSMHGYLVDDGIVEDLGFCDIWFLAETCRIPTLQYAFPFHLNEHSQGAFLMIKIVPGFSGIHNEFYFMKRPFHNRVSNALSLFIGMAAGVFFLVSILSFVFYRSLGEKSFGAYGLFYFNLFLAVFIGRGLWDAYKPDFITFTGATLYFPLLMGTVFFDLYFLKIFFEMKERHKRLNIIYNIMLFTFALAIVTSFFHETRTIAWRLLNPAIFASMIISAASLIYFIFKRRTWATPIATAWGVAIACNLIWTAYRDGSIEGFWFFGYYAILGRVLEAIILNNVLLQKLGTVTMRLGLSKAKEEKNAVIRTLLRTLSHDLANTTQVIQTSAQLIKQEPISDRAQSQMRYITEAAKTQSEIIQYAKNNYLIRGKEVLNLSPVNLEKCVFDVVTLFQAKFERKGVQLHVAFEKAEHRIIAESSTLVNQVLSNILANALKFTDAGKAVRIAVKDISAEETELLIEDEGIGIPVHILDNLFNENYLVNRPGTGGEAGTGVGLLIVKDFLGIYRARFKIDSTPGRGTKFMIYFQRPKNPDR